MVAVLIPQDSLFGDSHHRMGPVEMDPHGGEHPWLEKSLGVRNFRPDVEGSGIGIDHPSQINDFPGKNLVGIGHRFEKNLLPSTDKGLVPFIDVHVDEETREIGHGHELVSGVHEKPRPEAGVQDHSFARSMKCQVF